MLNQTNYSLSNYDDYFDSKLLHNNPYPFYKKLRNDSPIYWSDKLNSWVISSYNHVSQILKDFNQFSNAGRQMNFLNQFSSGDQKILEPLRKHYEFGGLIHSDPPQHTRLRKLLSKGFTSKILNSFDKTGARIITDQ